MKNNFENFELVASVTEAIEISASYEAEKNLNTSLFQHYAEQAKFEMRAFALLILFFSVIAFGVFQLL